jgi:chromosome segregation ATPase
LCLICRWFLPMLFFCGILSSRTSFNDGRERSRATKVEAKDCSMANTVDIERVLSGSVSEVTLDSLSKRGFKQVKVLNQANVRRLIAEAVDRVLSERSEQISEAEREKVIAESRTQFQSLANRKMDAERSKLEELELINRTLKEQLDAAKNRVGASMELQAERDQATARTASLENEVEGLQQQLDDLREHAQEKTQRVGKLRQELEARTEEATRLEERRKVEAQHLETAKRQALAEAEAITKRSADLEASALQQSTEVDQLRQQLAVHEDASGEKIRLEVEVAELRSELEVAELRSELEAKSCFEVEVAELRSDLKAKGPLEDELSTLRSDAHSAAVRSAEEKTALQEEVLEKERRIAELEVIVNARTKELEHARQTAETESTMARFMATFTERLTSAQPAGDEVADLKSALTGLTEKLANVSLGGGGGGSDGAPPPDAASLEAFFSKADSEEVESNVKNVKVRQSKAGGVTGALAKLKRMQQGGGETDE